MNFGEELKLPRMIDCRATPSALTKGRALPKGRCKNLRLPFQYSFMLMEPGSRVETPW